MKSFHYFLLSFNLLLASGFADRSPAEEAARQEPIREVVILHTNDFESAFNPIPAYWRPDVEYLGGGAELYDSFLNGTILRDRENSPKISTAILEYFSIHAEPEPPKMGRLIPFKG